jgi:hypothetical protein
MGPRSAERAAGTNGSTRYMHSAFTDCEIRLDAFCRICSILRSRAIRYSSRCELSWGRDPPSIYPHDHSHRHNSNGHPRRRLYVVRIENSLSTDAFRNFRVSQQPYRLRRYLLPSQQHPSHFHSHWYNLRIKRRPG